MPPLPCPPFHFLLHFSDSECACANRNGGQIFAEPQVHESLVKSSHVVLNRCRRSLEHDGGAGGEREEGWSCWLLSSNRSQVRRCRCRRTDGARRCWMFPLDGMRWRRAEGGRVFMSFSCLCVSSPATYELQRSRNLPRSAA